MVDSISFPHLGITFFHVGRGIFIGGFTIAYYGIVIALAMLGGICLALQVAKKTGQDPDQYFSFAILAIVLSLLGARAYYVIFSWDYYRTHLTEILNFRAGGLAIYGGVITGAVTAVVYSRVKKIKTGLFLDTACVGLITGQIIGRWGNFFNREAFGEYTDSLLAMRLPADAVNRADITEQMMEHAITENGVTFIQVHPTYLYESMWNLAVLALLLVITLRKKKKFDGEVFCLYLAGYGLGRLWIEGLRTDQLKIPGTNLAISQVLSGVLAAAAIGVLITQRVKNRRAHCAL